MWKELDDSPKKGWINLWGIMFFFFCKEFLNFFIRYSIFTPFFKYYNLLNRIIKQNFYSIISFRTKRFEYEIMNKSKRKRLNKRIKIRIKRDDIIIENNKVISVERVNRLFQLQKLCSNSCCPTKYQLSLIMLSTA